MLELDIEQIARTYGTRVLLQFGSAVTRAVHPRSDVDLALLNHTDPLFLKKVTDQCRPLYGAPTELRRLQLYAFRRYQNHQKYFDLERRFVAKAVTGAP